MTDHVKLVGELVQTCYDRARDEGTETRAVAGELVEGLPADLIRFMAAEFIVAAVARAQRSSALAVERSAESHGSSASESVGPYGRVPRKGTMARRQWEQTTEEGRLWAESEEKAELHKWQMFYGVIGTALDRYTEDMRIKWTTELLDSSFALANGSLVTWGDATVEQHAERRQIFLNNAHANMEGAARHELAMRELAASGATCLREAVSAAA